MTGGVSKRSAWGTGMVILATAFLLVVSPPPASADHEPDHRLKVFGTVVGPDGRPLGGAAIEVAVPAAGLEEKLYTSGSGKYEVELHLHDADLGKPVSVTVGSLKEEREIVFDEQDKESERKMRIDLSFEKSSSGDSLAGVERRNVIWNDYGFFIILGIIAAAIAAAVLAGRLRRKSVSAVSADKGVATKRKSGRKSGKKKTGGRRR